MCHHQHSSSSPSSSTCATPSALHQARASSWRRLCSNFKLQNASKVDDDDWSEIDMKGMTRGERQGNNSIEDRHFLCQDNLLSKHLWSLNLYQRQSKAKTNQTTLHSACSSLISWYLFCVAMCSFVIACCFFFSRKRGLTESKDSSSHPKMRLQRQVGDLYNAKSGISEQGIQKSLNNHAIQNVGISEQSCYTKLQNVGGSSHPAASLDSKKVGGKPCAVSNFDVGTSEVCYFS